MTSTVGMILAAGLGTRLKPWTDHHPKALAVVNGRTVLERNVRYLQTAGVEHIVINVHHFADQIIAAVEENHGWGVRISISNETDEVLETGGGVQKALHLFGQADRLLLMNADILTDLNLQQLLHSHEQRQAEATLAVTNRQSSRCFLFDDNDRLCGWRNKKTGETKQPLAASPVHERSFSGIHVINRSVFAHMPLQGKFSMVDAYLAMCATHRMYGFDHSGSQFIDIGTMEKLEAAAGLFP